MAKGQLFVFVCINLLLIVNIPFKFIKRRKQVIFLMMVRQKALIGRVIYVEAEKYLHKLTNIVV